MCVWVSKCTILEVLWFFLILIALPTLKIYYKFGFTCVWVCAYVYKYLCVCKHIWEICVASPKKKKEKNNTQHNVGTSKVLRTFNRYRTITNIEQYRNKYRTI